jgi:hypothetical protein
MSYTSIAQAAEDKNLRLRVAACVAANYHNPADQRHVLEVTDLIMWRVCAQPGWGDAYEYALLTDVPDPGGDPAVITDAMVLAAVTAVLDIE